MSNAAWSIVLRIKLYANRHVQISLRTVSGVWPRSNTSVASDSEPRDAREQLSFYCTFFSSLACCIPRKESTIALNKNSRTIMQYWSRNRLRLPALSRSVPAGRRRSSSGASYSKYFKPVMSLSVIFFLRAMMLDKIAAISIAS